MPWAGNIAKTVTSNGKQFTVTREMLTAVAGISARDEVEGNIEILGKQNSLFPSGPVIKCLVLWIIIGLEAGDFSLICRYFWCDIYPWFYHDNCTNLGLGLFSFFLKCSLVICFCSAYVICLFGLCPRFLDPASDNISHYLIWSLHVLTEIYNS